MAPGSGLAEPFTRNIEGLAHNSHLTMVAIFGVFALVHSGLAFLRPYGEPAATPALLGAIQKLSHPLLRWNLLRQSCTDDVLLSSCSKGQVCASTAWASGSLIDFD